MKLSEGHGVPSRVVATAFAGFLAAMQPHDIPPHPATAVHAAETSSLTTEAPKPKPLKATQKYGVGRVDKLEIKVADLELSVNSLQASTFKKDEALVGFVALGLISVVGFVVVGSISVYFYIDTTNRMEKQRDLDDKRRNKEKEEMDERLKDMSFWNNVKFGITIAIAFVALFAPYTLKF